VRTRPFNYPEAHELAVALAKATGETMIKTKPDIASALAA
jgi:hypothetical protein